MAFSQAPSDMQSQSNTQNDTNNYSSEEQHILNTAKRNKEGKLLAPNGKVSNLTEKQYAQVRTKAFINWFLQERDNHDFKNHKQPFKHHVEFYEYLGFDKVYKGPLQFRNYILSHEPVLLDDKNDFLNIHGHTHQYFVKEDYFISDYNKQFPKQKVDPTRYKNVCMDANNFELLKLSDVMKF